jgi:predicted nucleic acid-binding protein
MSGPPLVVADTTPLNYLILIGQAHVLGALFGKVLVPEGVLAELGDPKAAVAVTLWIQSLPAWLDVARVRQVDNTILLGKGEVEAISLALEKQVEIVLMDERKGRAAAQSRGLLPVGTLNLIDLADEKGLLNGIEALNDFRRTTFRADRRLVEQLESKILSRRA